MNEQRQKQAERAMEMVRQIEAIENLPANKIKPGDALELREGDTQIICGGLRAYSAFMCEWVHVRTGSPPKVNEIDFDSGMHYLVVKENQAGGRFKDVGLWAPDTGNEWSWVGDGANDCHIVYWLNYTLPAIPPKVS